MSEQTTQAIAPSPVLPDEQTPPDRRLTVFARNPQEMNVAQGQLVAWVKNKLAEVAADRDELQQNYEIATRNGIGYSGIARQLGKAKKRIEFYEKVQAALQAGYCIVPNFPIDVFAVRTNKFAPEKSVQRGTSTWSSPDLPAARSESPPLGDGAFMSSTVEGRERMIHDEANKHVGYESWATAFRDVDFPFAVAQPAVLNATAQALADRIFDELGVSPTRAVARKGDPMVIGRIYAPGYARWQRDTKALSFVVAWFLRPDRDLNF